MPWLFATGNHDMEALYDDNTAPGGAAHGYAGHAARLDLPRTGPSELPVGVLGGLRQRRRAQPRRQRPVRRRSPPTPATAAARSCAGSPSGSPSCAPNPDIDFVVAFFHHCAFATSSNHASDGGVRAALAPLFDRFSVDLVVQGHNHQYERTNPIRGGRSHRAGPRRRDRRAGDARHHLHLLRLGRAAPLRAGSPARPTATGARPTAAGASPPIPDSGTTVTSFVAGPDGAKNPETVDWSQARYLDYAFLAVHVTPAAAGGTATMSVRAITDRGTEIDRVDLVRTVGGSARRGADGHARRPGAPTCRPGCPCRGTSPCERYLLLRLATRLIVVARIPVPKR